MLRAIEQYGSPLKTFSSDNPFSHILALNPIAFWPINTEGDLGKSLISGIPDGSVTGVTYSSNGPDTLGSGSWDGVNDVINIYSTELNSVYNGSEGTIAIYIKVGSGGWTDGVNRWTHQIQGNGAANRNYSLKSSASNRFDMYRRAGVVTSFYIRTGWSPSDWTHVAMTWSMLADEVKYYHDGVLVDTDTGLGTYAGPLTSGGCIIGASNSSGGSSWYGNLARFCVFDYPLSNPQILQVMG